MDERMKSEITVLQEISSAIVHERNADALLNKVLDVLNRRMGMLRGTFTLLQGDTLTIEASQGLDENEKQLGRYHIGEGITGHVAETGRPHLIPDIRRDSRFLNRTKSRDSKEPRRLHLRADHPPRAGGRHIEHRPAHRSGHRSRERYGAARNHRQYHGRSGFRRPEGARGAREPPRREPQAPPDACRRIRAKWSATAAPCSRSTSWSARWPPPTRPC